MLVILERSRGFTLIELTMVIFIIGLILGGLLTPLSYRLEQENRARSRDYLDEVNEAILGYTLINGRLPCPDCPDSTICIAGTANDGIEDMMGVAGSRICETSIGNIPWVDLQVNEYDAWNRHLTYRVEPDFADETDGADGCDTVSVGISFELCARGDIDIYSAYDTAGSAGYTGRPTVADDVVAVIVSHGDDGNDSLQTDVQVENFDRNPVNPDTGRNILGSYTTTDHKDKVFIMKDYAVEGIDAYDDLMKWISPHILMNRMVLAGRLP